MLIALVLAWSSVRIKAVFKPGMRLIFMLYHNTKWREKLHDREALMASRDTFLIRRKL